MRAVRRAGRGNGDDGPLKADTDSEERQRIRLTRPGTSTAPLLDSRSTVAPRAGVWAGSGLALGLRASRSSFPPWLPVSFPRALSLRPPSASRTPDPPRPTPSGDN